MARMAWSTPFVTGINLIDSQHTGRDGHIKVKSNPGVGKPFTISRPIVSPETPTEADGAS